MLYQEPAKPLIMMSTLSASGQRRVCVFPDWLWQVAHLPDSASRFEARYPYSWYDGPITIVGSPVKCLMRGQVLSLQGKGTRAFQVGWCELEDD